MAELKSYEVWDAHTRWFHWVNVLCVLGLTAIGVAILNAKLLGITRPTLYDLIKKYNLHVIENGRD